MKAALLALSLLSQPTVQIADRVPNVDIKALCRDVSADDQALGLAQDASKCVNDETSARQQLSANWLTVPEPARESCEGEAMSGGIQSDWSLSVEEHTRAQRDDVAYPTWQLGPPTSVWERADVQRGSWARGSDPSRKSSLVQQRPDML